jgi:hypothetical protein
MNLIVKNKIEFRKNIKLIMILLNLLILTIVLKNFINK